ncbi:ribokinase [Trueperella pecoris]|uniref:Ribokinase n=1 Tax=Trueperella pecoris TaxID=2733571 RepID=A0A7M1R1M1_9ACTO|nr:ribokinase [Trueperella pecoris]QOR48048.1 ribokinase [Trueperella pecoris]
MKRSVVVVGSVNADLVVSVDRHPAPGETVHGRGGTISPGGKGANQALAAALMGADVTLVGAVGDDENAATALRLLDEAGVDLTLVATRGEVTGLAVVAVDRRGENNIIVIGGANELVSPESLDESASVISEAEVVVLQGEIPVESIAHAAELARGRLVVNLAPVVDVAPAVLLKADPLVVNEYEAGLALKILRGVSAGEDAAGEGFEALASALRSAGVPSVILTIGAGGAIVADGEITHVPSPDVKVVGTTGAGDAFVGGLAARLAQGEDLVAASRFAVRVGAAACTGSGAQPSYPRSADALPPEPTD